MQATPSTPHDVVFLFDCDNTLLDNDHVLSDLRTHLMREFGAENSERYWEIFEDCARNWATRTIWAHCSATGSSIRATRGCC